jgi:hypothetical protein
VSVVDGSGDPSAEDLLRGVLANASVASAFSSPQFTYTAASDLKGACARHAHIAWGYGGACRRKRSGPPRAAPGRLHAALAVPASPQHRTRSSGSARLPVSACGAARARNALPARATSVTGGSARAAAGLDNIVNKNYDYAVSSLAVPASTLAAQQAAGCAQGRGRVGHHRVELRQ